MKLKLFAVAAIALACASNLTWAEEAPAAPADSGQQAGRQHHTPPPEAYAACDGKAAGAAASFTNHRGEAVDGVCQPDPSGKLVVRRNHKGAEGQPPQGDAAQPPAGMPPN